MRAVSEGQGCWPTARSELVGFIEDSWITVGRGDNNENCLPRGDFDPGRMAVEGPWVSDTFRLDEILLIPVGHGSRRPHSDRGPPNCQGGKWAL